MLNMFTNFSKFARDESGAVSVNWTVLTASVVLLSVVILSSVGSGTNSLAGNSKDHLENTQVATYHAANGTDEAAKKAGRKVTTSGMGHR